MNDDQFKALFDLLVEIRDALKAAPRARASSGGVATPKDKEPALAAPDEPWARFGWPQFTNKSGKRRAVTLGESVANEYGRKDLQWWADNYKPREYKGSIAAKDIEFRDCLTMAAKWLASQGTADHASSPPPTAPKKPAPTDAQLANQTNDIDQDPDAVPF